MIIYELGYIHCISLINRWFWGEGSYPTSTGELKAVWDNVGRLKGNLLLNVPPDKTGQIPQAFIQRLNDFNPFSNSVSSLIVDDINISEPESSLSQNCPNPFNQFTTIEYYLPESGDVTLKVYNITGQEIEILVNEYQFAGEHKTIWQPNGLPEGIYLFKLQSGIFSETRKLILGNDSGLHVHQVNPGYSL